MDPLALLKRRAGQTGEDAAARELKRHGCEIIARNARSKLGETDLIVRDGEYIAFVEVRSRREGSPVAPRETITAAKQQRLRRLAESYLRERKWVGQRWRIDVVEVTTDAGGKAGAITWLKAAVGGGR
jgi:putative endonuclease